MQKTKLRRSHRGFTLVEIAIVLVIIGLLIGGILRGQELITTAKVRSTVSQGSSLKSAFNIFYDRYRMVAGDLTQTQATQLLGSGGLGAGTPSNGTIESGDGLVVFQNLAVAKLINCAACLNITWATSPLLPENTLTNPFGLPLFALSYGGNATSLGYLSPTTDPTLRTLLYTGYGPTPSMLAEIDRKVDDGLPASGDFRYGFTFSLSSLGIANVLFSCVNGSLGASPTGGISGTFASWSSTSTGNNCTGVWLF
jgi:prepilin-type N-terminal cleavage/methylation domain-containing protein